MALKKALDSEGMYVVSSNEGEVKYPIGFSYRMGSAIYTVKEIVSKDISADLRRVMTSDGTVEIMETSTIDKDLRDVDTHILSTGEVVKEGPAEETGKQKSE